MKLNNIMIYATLCAILALKGCGGGSHQASPPQENRIIDNTASAEETTTRLGGITGKVSSELTDVKLCQLYLYNVTTTEFADAYKPNHPDFNPPSVPITRTAPVDTSKISDTGSYVFNDVEVGTYKLVLNCLVGQDIQDESQLVDDPIQYDGFTIPNPSGIQPNLVIVSVTEDNISNNDFVDTTVVPITNPKADVIVRADITESSNYQANLYDMWNTINRIAPKTGVTAIDGLNINTVRMLGGINKKDAQGNNVPDLEYDTATYNAQTNTYEYNFTPLTERIDAIIDRGQNLFQIVLDQPPWAFQTGHTFISGNEFDGVNFLEKQRISHYGNSLPPKDKVAYNHFLQAMMNHLLLEYGTEKVLSWRFRIGTEIETPDHWYGSERDFVEHFANSVNAIRAVLPEAIIGLHTRAPNFIYKNGTVTNYKFEPIKSFANAIIEYSYENNIQYDFWGVSDYPFINRADTRDPKTKYDSFFKGLVEHPKWRQGTIIDIEEYTVITRMGFVPPYYAYIRSESPHADTLNVALTSEFYKNNVQQVFQWGLRNGDKPWFVEAFSSMVNQPMVKAEVKTKDNVRVNNLDSIIVTNPDDNSVTAITYHYDPKDLEAINDRDFTLSIATNKPIGSTYYFRKKLAAPENHAFYTFMAQPGAAAWLKTEEAYFTKYGHPDIVLNDVGTEKWLAYQHTNASQWSAWESAQTVSRDDNQAGSEININSTLPLFSFEKTEVKWDNQ